MKYGKHNHLSRSNLEKDGKGKSPDERLTNRTVNKRKATRMFRDFFQTFTYRRDENVPKSGSPRIVPIRSFSQFGLSQRV